MHERHVNGTVKLQGEEVAKVEDFKYPYSTVESNGECGREVKKRVQAGWNGWRSDLRQASTGWSEREGVQGGSVTSNAVRVGAGGTDEKTGGGYGGGRVEDVTIFVKSDKNRQDEE